MQPIPRSPVINFIDNLENYASKRSATRHERAHNIYEWHIQQLTPAELSQYQQWEYECREAHRLKIIRLIRQKQFAHVFLADVPKPKK